MNDPDTPLVLVVDDDPILLRGLTRLLGKAGYEAIQANTGLDALQLARENKPELILLDMNLPDLNGKEVCRRIKADPELRNAYVLFLSAAATESVHQAEGLEAGADGYIAQPVSNRELLARIESMLRLKKTESKLARSLDLLKKSDQDMRSLLDAAKSLIQAEDFDAAARGIFEAAKKATGATAGYVALLTEDRQRNELRFLDPGDLTCSVDPSLPMPVRGMRAEAYSSGRAIRENDFADSLWRGLLPEGHVSLQNVMFAPLMVRGKPEGFLGLANKEGGFTEADETLAATFAEFAAVGFLKSRAEGELRESEGRFRTLSDATFEGVLIHDQGLILDANESFARMFGYEVREIPGRQLKDFVDPAFWDKVAEHCCEETSGPCELLGSRKDGVKIWVEMNARRLPRRGREVSVAAMRDVSERKTAEEVLRRSEAFNRSIIESSVDCIKVLDVEGRLKFMSQGGQRLMGVRDITPYLDVPYDSFWEGDGRKLATEALIKARKGQQTSFSAFWPTLLGEPKWWEVAVTPIYGANGKMENLLAVSRDITARKIAEQALQESQENFQQLAENIQEVFWIAEPEDPGKVVYLSPAFERMWGISPEEACASPETLRGFIREEDREQVLQAYKDFLAGRGEFDIEYRIDRPDGAMRWIRDRAFLIKDSTGKPYRVTGLAQDITGFKEYLERQRELMDEIRHFAYIISHDLRAPLVNLTGFTRELRDSWESVKPAAEEGLKTLPEHEGAQMRCVMEQDIPEALAFLDFSSATMNRLIDSVLRISRLGHTELVFETLSMNDLVQRTLNTMAHQINERDIQIMVDDLPDIVADLTSMEQIMSNLISNAIKYLDPDRPGAIAISGKRSGDETVFRVKDNGVGIASVDRERIFQIFQRAGGHVAKGDGVGLTCVRTLVRRHLGRIWCDSTAGEGSEFLFTISNRLRPENSEAGR